MIKSSYKPKRNLLFLLSNFLFSMQINAQFISLQGHQFKDQSGANFYPLICNYNIVWAKDGNGFFMMPSTKYGNNGQADCQSLTACQQSIRDDFNEIEQMGFNTIRIGINISKDIFHYPKCYSGYGTPPHEFKDKFVLNYDIFPDPAFSCAANPFAYQGNGEAQRFLDILPPYDFTSNQNLQAIISPLMNVFSYAKDEGLHIILITGGGRYLLNDDEYPTVGSNTSLTEHENHVNDYAALLAGIAQALKNETALLAYDIWNEPAWHDEDIVHTKSQVCNITSQWYNAIRNVDHHHLITMGLSNFHDVMEWDPAVLKLDFLSEHMYPDAPSFEFNDATITHDQTKLKDRYHAELLWLKRNAPMPWIIGETGFSASSVASQTAADQVHLHGTEAEQAVFANFALNEARNAGSSGMSWWQFQDVDWYGPTIGSLYKENWFGFLKRGTPSNGNYSALRKPCATEFQNFVPATFGSFDQSLNSVYYDPYHFATLNPTNAGSISGLVVAGIQPIQDAVIKAFNWMATVNTGTIFEPVYKNTVKTIYTFSDQNGHFILRPFNDLTPGNLNSYRIIELNCSAIGCNKIDIYSSGNTPLSGPINFILTQGDLTQSNSTQVIENQIINFNISGSNYLNLNDDMILPLTNVTIQAGKEINIGPEFEVKYGSEVHFFIENANGNCIDFANVRTSNPNTAIENNEAKNDFKEIEVQFKKTGRQIIEVIIQPNPSDGIVYLNVLENTSNEWLDIQVFNTLGQNIKTYHTSESSLLLDGIQWQKGVYFISIKNENSNMIKKVIIN
jgi:hypothetical protein